MLKVTISGEAQARRDFGVTLIRALGRHFGIQRFGIAEWVERFCAQDGGDTQLVFRFGSTEFSLYTVNDDPNPGPSLPKAPSEPKTMTADKFGEGVAIQILTPDLSDTHQAKLQSTLDEIYNERQADRHSGQFFRTQSYGGGGESLKRALFHEHVITAAPSKDANQAAAARVREALDQLLSAIKDAKALGLKVEIAGLMDSRAGLPNSVKITQSL
ncbi:hypothetical protein AEAC466_04455 [Asticcacaulis sp. AC466]|uniref:hypothetical protein n=1 Tax=Asticcacaulis sp. AC466 TaxID=1282362 RepID=UPI0003C409A8|nr:hypothetical protein [Asticcacaulis sp. AC466]ESQ85421.1 hypothetical protein AEAC466_04455 [Asticcacaulis sp. AC466]